MGQRSPEIPSAGPRLTWLDPGDIDEARRGAGRRRDGGLVDVPARGPVVRLLDKTRFLHVGHCVEADPVGDGGQRHVTAAAAAAAAVALARPSPAEPPAPVAGPGWGVFGRGGRSPLPGRRGRGRRPRLHVDAPAQRGVVGLLQEARVLHRGHGVEGHLVGDGRQRHVHVHAVRSRLVEDHALPGLLDLSQRACPVEHGLHAPVHAVAAPPGRLVGVGLHARQVGRHALAVGTPSVQRGHLPVTGQLLRHEAPEALHEVVRGPGVVLEDQGQGRPVRHYLGLRLEVRGGAAHGPQDATHVLLRPVGDLLREREVELRRYPARGLRLGELARIARVHAGHVRRPDAQALEPVGDHPPAVDVRQEAQHIDTDMVPEPFARCVPLLGCPLAGPAKLRPVAHLRVRQAVEGVVLPGWGGAEASGHVLQPLPGHVVLEVVVAGLLHADPAPVPVLSTWSTLFFTSQTRSHPGGSFQLRRGAAASTGAVTLQTSGEKCAEGTVCPGADPISGLLLVTTLMPMPMSGHSCCTRFTRMDVPPG
eukprot:CAMPEP_0168388708 /NCGR_PEP_ID=MMETSP0228-20121227/16590_1 /TAXON_ID=133427 /ORGANISM="Protoceratium reticulatum, Strain CCCM 535 (=CCMP 1889)" /LENGTH=534 /DNA_ID=CAMNT_0008401963 /DNA_START=36 /DNA_END=1641 /DNA_ORIENTATION=+